MTPGSGNFSTARFTSESLSGTPGTTQSQQIRTDRMSSGQIVTSLAVGGDTNFELAKEAPIDDFMASAMLNDWETFNAISVELAINATLKTLTRTTGSWPVTLRKGDIITLDGFLNEENNVQVMVTEVTSATVVSFVGPDNMITETSAASTFEQADRLSIGTVIKSFSMQKRFEDLTTKAIVYKGMAVSAMNLEVAYGDIITGSFTFQGNYYQTADAASEMITDGRTINPAPTSQSMNGSIDMPFIATSAAGPFDSAGFCIQSVSLALDNQFTVKNCIGVVAPTGYSPGQANITIEMSSYLSDDNWALLPKKLTQESFEIGFMVKNLDGWYGFYLPAVQVSFDDPASGGQNQEVSLEMSGTAKVGPNGESALTIYRS